MFCQILVAFAEMLTPKKAIVCREGRRVCTFKDEVVGVGDKLLFAPCVCSPKQIHNGGCAVIERLDDGVCHLLPALAFVAVGLSSTDGEDRVQKQHSLLCPVDEIGVGVGNAKVTFDLLEHVDK